MDYLTKYHSVKVELMKFAMYSNFNEIKKIYFENNNKLDKFNGWTLLGDLFMYSCDTMNLKLLETLYEIYENIDIAIRLDNNLEIFYKSILFQNTLFYTQLLSRKGPLFVFNKNKQNLIDYTIEKRSHFIPILE